MRDAGERCRIIAVSSNKIGKNIKMSVSTFQKVTLVSCAVLCVALLLPKMLLSGGKRDAAMDEGSFPPMMQRKSPGILRGAGGSRAHTPEAIARAKSTTPAAGKSNLAGQIIPVYGFGILLYILYIIFKITSKGKSSKPHESRFPTMRSENMKRKITDFELMQLQERLKETEEVMERIVSRARDQHENINSSSVSMDQEKNLLLQLKEITRVMKEGCLVDGLPSAAKKQDHDDHFTRDDVWTPRCSLHTQNQSESCCERTSPAKKSMSDDLKAKRDEDDDDGGKEEKDELLSTHIEGPAEDEDQSWNRTSGTSEIRRRRAADAPS